MNGAELHLALNHLPLFGTFAGLVFLLIALLKNSRELKQAGLWLCLAAALGAIPTYLTGEPAEHRVRSLPGIERDRIDEHQDAALWALVGIEILGAVSLAGLYLSQKSGQPPDRLVQVCLILSLAAFAIIGRTAYLGGQIHHPETRSGFQTTP